MSLFSSRDHCLTRQIFSRQDYLHSPPPSTHSSSSSPQQQQFHLTTNQNDHCRPHPSAKPTADHTPHPNIQRYPTSSTQSICSSVLVYTSSWWKTNASRSLNIPSHVHVPGCMRACRSTIKRQHAKAGFGPGWFQTKCVAQRQCATRCIQNSRRANPVSSRLSYPGID